MQSTMITRIKARCKYTCPSTNSVGISTMLSMNNSASLLTKSKTLRIMWPLRAHGNEAPTTKDKSLLMAFIITPFHSRAFTVVTAPITTESADSLVGSTSSGTIYRRVSYTCSTSDWTACRS